jgi:hypothetical protein
VSDATGATFLAVFIEHCGECSECSDTMRDDNGYPGLCDVGARLWVMLGPDDQANAYEEVE